MNSVSYTSNEEGGTTQVSQIQCSEISSSTEKDEIIFSDTYSDYDSNGELFSCTYSDSGGKIWIETYWVKENQIRESHFT